MSKRSKPVSTSRRKFLRDATVMSGATALAVVAKTGVADMRTETTDEVCAAESKGYHVTPHIREYYEKARF